MTTERRAIQPTTETWRLHVVYNGAKFSGWQRQLGNVRTIQQTIEDALIPMAGEEVAVQAAGRTDAGVHALGQVASVRMTSRLTPRKFVLALSCHLPPDLSVLKAEIVPAQFSAKRHSVGKHYRYAILNHPARDPFRSPYTWHQRQWLDVERMKEAAKVLVGDNDFESFRSVHCDSAHARRFIWAVDVNRDDDDAICIDVKGNAFCRSMVRIISGTLVDVGRRRFSVSDVEDILRARKRELAGKTAPAQGLTLMRVFYPDTAEEAGIPEGARFPGWPVNPNYWPPSNEPPKEGMRLVPAKHRDDAADLKRSRHARESKD